MDKSREKEKSTTRLDPKAKGQTDPQGGFRAQPGRSFMAACRKSATREAPPNQPRAN